MKKSEAEFIEIFGKSFVCRVCDSSTFFHGKAQLNTAVATFFNFDFANRTARYLACSKCGHISWFRL